MLGDGDAGPKVCSRASFSSYPCAGSFASSASRGCRTFLPPDAGSRYLIIMLAAGAFVPHRLRAVTAVDIYLTRVHNMYLSQSPRGAQRRAHLMEHRWSA